MNKDLNLNVLLKAVDKATKPLKDIREGSGKTAEALKASRKQLRELEGAQKNLRGFRELKTQSESTASSLHDEQKRIAALTREIKQATGPTKRLTQSRNKAIRTAGKLKAQYQGEQTQLEGLRRDLKRVDGLTGTYAEQQRELARRVAGANREIKQQEESLSRVARRQKRAAQAARRYGRMQGRASSMVTAGAGGMATGGAALYGASRLLAPGISYGEQNSELQAVTGLDKKSASFKTLSKQSRDLGASTQFSATEAAAGQTFLARAGFTPKAIHASMQDVLNEALVGKLDLSRAADITSNIAGVFQIDPEKAGNITKVVDTLTAASTHANVNIEQLGDTMKYLGQAKGLHVTLQQSAALAGILGNMGIQATQAGTTLRQMMNRITKNTPKVQAAKKALNLDIADDQGNLKSLPDILKQIAKSTEKMGNVKRSALLNQLFGSRAGAGVGALLDKLGPQGLEGLLHSVSDATGATQKAATVMADNAGGDLKSLSSAWQEVGISIEDVNDGPLRDMIQSLTAVTRGVGDWIKANPKLASALTIAAGALAVLVAAGGALTFILGSILGPMVLLPMAITKARDAMIALNIAMDANPIGLVVLAIAALAGAAYLIYKNWGDISQFFSDRWADIKAAFHGGTGAVLKLLLNWSPIGLIYKAIIAGLQKLGIEIPQKFQTLGSAIIDGVIGGIKDKLIALKNAVTGVASSAAGWFKDKLGIHSPSRVFLGYGENTVEGYRLGLARNEPRVLGQVGAMGRRIKQAGAGFALAGGLGASATAGAQTPLSSQPIAFDQRPAMSAPAASAGRADININFTGDVTIRNGQDEQQFMATVQAAVQKALDERDRAAGARSRSALYDRD